MVFKISTSSSAPSGSTYYRLIAKFYNNSSGSITDLISYPQDYGADYPWESKGWINFNGTGTIAINSSYNVSSITDNGTGDYTINWETDFADANYACAGLGRISTLYTATVNQYALSDNTASSARIGVTSTLNTLIDADDVSIICFGQR